MSVPKSRRTESRFEAQHQFFKLRHEVTTLVLNDFGFSEKKYREKMEKYRAALFLAFSIIVIVGIYWCHYPYGRRHRRDKRR